MNWLYTASQSRIQQALRGNPINTPSPISSSMADSQTSFWSPARIGAVIGAVLLIVALAVLVSLPQNQRQRDV